jgi:prepilin-type N-terminal cleavage/methylation domain-containing protein
MRTVIEPRRRRPRAGAARRANRGFTILEILVATAILVIGLVGVLALFPAGIYVGKEVVETSTSITLARSVADAIRSSFRTNLRQETKVRDANTYHYFVLTHDGVSPAPSDRRREQPTDDYYILLPMNVPGRPVQASQGKSPRQAAAFVTGKTFLFPEDDRDNPNGFGDPFRADNDADDWVDRANPENRGVLVKSTYKFGAGLPSGDVEGPQILDDQKVEVLKQYSFAFTVRSSTFDANMDFYGGNFIPANRLYHFRVMIFRAFEENYVEGGDPVKPVYELDFEVSL